MTVRTLLIGLLLLTLICPASAQNYDPVRDRVYGYKDQKRPWTERPAVPANTIWTFSYGHIGSDHEKGGAIELLPDGRIRVWHGSSDLSPQRIEVTAGYVGNRQTTVLANVPNADIEKIIYAPYTWGYDDNGILTFYSGKGGERLKVAWKLYMVYYYPDDDVLMFQGQIPDRPGEMVGIVSSGRTTDN